MREDAARRLADASERIESEAGHVAEEFADLGYIVVVVVVGYNVRRLPSFYYKLGHVGRV